ncbi:phage tail sheath family protein [Paenibacillus sp. MZ04-78.2]|uniref:phage tail sheath family protein n=1 Tax=Paenibacillus sp. MZ04-78.2 TaxID=2962034 RepID=UPI0020B68E9F|nr:phage tail sheath family protein [Paenibacillus sp. MZ04-78.2]MCP3773656.1 phage tail sheath family protein [Paenibacillus sp. MZ04-78.2]
MAGGTWTTQNKVRPGVYINFEGEGKPAGTAGDRGIMTMALPLGWGEAKKVLTINAGDDVKTMLGYDITAPQLLLVREALKRAKTVLLYRLNAGTKAEAKVGALTVTAKHGGVRGNDLSVVVQANIDDSKKFDVKTLLAGQVLDIQTVVDINELKANDWVEFYGKGDSSPTTAGASLTSGADGTVTNQDHTDYLAAIEVFDFQTMALASGDATLKSVYTAFVKRLRDTEGKKVQAVLENYPAADFEGIISVKNGVVLTDGTVLDAVKATVWVAAATAGAQVNQSLTYQAYDDAVDADIRYTNSQIESALRGGEVVFVQNKGRAIVEQDLNTFKSFLPTKGKAFSKNRVIRALDGIANDIKRIFETFYIGKVNNDHDGRNLLWNEVVTYLRTLQANAAIQNFNSQTDVKVIQGQDVDSVYVELHIQPVDSIEKIYMKVTVK